MCHKQKRTGSYERSYKQKTRAPPSFRRKHTIYESSHALPQQAVLTPQILKIQVKPVIQIERKRHSSRRNRVSFLELSKRKKFPRSFLFLSPSTTKDVGEDGRHATLWHYVKPLLGTMTARHVTTRCDAMSRGVDSTRKRICNMFFSTCRIACPMPSKLVHTIAS